MKTKDILVSIIGLDEPGIVAATAETLTRLGCNIEQMTQTTLRDQFTAVYLVNKPEDIENKNIRLEIQTAYDAKKFHLTVSIRDVETAEGKAAAGRALHRQHLGPRPQRHHRHLRPHLRGTAHQRRGPQGLPHRGRPEPSGLRGRHPRAGRHPLPAPHHGRARQAHGAEALHAARRHLRSHSPRPCGLRRKES